jgi:hypothetical protein
MARPRRFALALLCAAAAIAGGAARLSGFEWSGIENSATAIWNRGAAVASADAGPVGALLTRAIASVGAMTMSHRELSEPADASAAAAASDAVDPDPRETAFGLASVSATEAPVIEAPEKLAPLVSLFRPEPVEEEAQPAARAG